MSDSTSCPERADVVIVGGGVIGASAAYHLSASGARVVLLERGAVGSGASSANPGTVALASKKPGLSLRLAIESRRRFDRLAADLDHDIEFEVCGCLVVAETDEEMAFLSELAEQQQQAGADVEVVDTRRARELAPLLSDQVVGGTYCASDGQVNPFQLTYAYARAAEARGATIAGHSEVTSIDIEADRVVGVRVGEHRIRARWVVNAAGVDASKVGKMVGVEHQVTPRRGQVMVLSAPGDDLPSVKVMSTRQLLAKHRADPSLGRLSFGYARKARSGTVILGSTNEDAGLEKRTTDEGLTWIAGYASRLMPGLTNLPVVRAWAGLRPYHAGGPIVGRAGGPAGYVAATGHAGDGVALSPVTGAYVADIIGSGAEDLSAESALEPAWVAE